VGVNLGDIIIEDGDIHGDGVNVAARLEGIAEPGGICISGTVRDHVGDRLDLTFDDLADQNLKNIARPVRVYRVRVADAPTTAASSKPAPPALALPDKPSIAVLPFQNMSGDPEQEYFVDGMVEEIITALSRIRWLFVIARNSSFTYKGQNVDVKRVSRELGVRYVLEGSVRRAGDRVRITAQLIDAETGSHLWADRFDGSLEDVFDVQDQVAVAVAGVIEPAVHIAETRRAEKRPITDLTTYDLYLRAAFELGGSAEKDRLVAAAGVLDEAINRDPRFTPALGAAAAIRVVLDVQGGAPDLEQNCVDAVGLAHRCVNAATDDPNALCMAAFALGYFGEDIAAAIALLSRGLALNPSFAVGWLYASALSIYAGKLREGIEQAERAMRLNPNARMGLGLALIGFAHFFDGSFDLAEPKLREAIQQLPSYVTAYRFLAACYAHLGRLVEAREMVEKLRAMNALDEPRITHWRRPEHRELLVSGLRLAANQVN
jgi:adenylate cyclase